MFLQLEVDQSHRQAGAENGDIHVQLLQHVGQCPDVVLMSVGEDDPFQVVLPFDDVTHVGDDDVHAEHVVGGEHQPHIDDDHRVPVLVNHHVAADLPQAAQGNDMQYVVQRSLL